MYGRIPYLNNSLSSWATHYSNLRRLLYYTAVWLGASPSVPLTICHDTYWIWAHSLDYHLDTQLILITIRIYWTQKINPQWNGSSNDTTERNSNSLINLARNLSILTNETKPTPPEIRAISCETNLIKERNQTTVESVRILDFLQQLKDLPD